MIRNFGICSCCERPRMRDASNWCMECIQEAHDFGRIRADVDQLPLPSSRGRTSRSGAALFFLVGFGLPVWVWLIFKLAVAW